MQFSRHRRRMQQIAEPYVLQQLFALSVGDGVDLLGAVAGRIDMNPF